MLGVRTRPEIRCESERHERDLHARRSLIVHALQMDHEILLECLPLSFRVTSMANVQGPVLLLHCKRASCSVDSETGHGLILHTRPEIANLVSLAHDQVHEKVH